MQNSPSARVVPLYGTPVALQSPRPIRAGGLWRFAEWPRPGLLMRCYFWGINNMACRDQRGHGLACFAIPDWGVQFRTAHEGTASECEYAALLSLLRFVDANPKVFEGKRLEVLSDAAALVEQVNRRLPTTPAQAKSLTLVRALRERIPFDLLWIPPDQNCAIQGVLGLAPLRTKIPLEFAPHDPPSPTPRFTPDDLLS